MLTITPTHDHCTDISCMHIRPDPDPGLSLALPGSLWACDLERPVSAAPLMPAGWRKDAAGVLEALLSSDDAWPFAEPVPRDTEYYYDVIEHPTDLGTVRKRLRSGDFCDASRAFLEVQQVSACAAMDAAARYYGPAQDRL